MTSPTPPSEESSASPSGSATPNSDEAKTPSAVLTPPSGTPSDPLVSPRIRNGIAVVITAMWAAGIIADALSKSFELSPFVYVTMLGLASALFGTNFLRGVK